MNFSVSENSVENKNTHRFSYMSYLEGLQRKQSTLKFELFNLGVFEMFMAANDIQDFADVTEPNLIKYRHELISKNYKAKTVESYTRTVVGFYKFLELSNQIFLSPVPPDYVPYAKRKENPVILSVEEVQTLISSADDMRFKAQLQLLYSTAIRKAELLSLNVSSINKKDKTIRFMGKGNKEALIALTDTAFNNLKEYLTHQNSDADALWIDRKGERLSVNAFDAQVRRLVTKIGIKFSAHLIRRSASSHWLARGMCPFILSKHILRHDDIVSLSAYLNTPIETLIETHERLKR